MTHVQSYNTIEMWYNQINKFMMSSPQFQHLPTRNTAQPREWCALEDLRRYTATEILRAPAIERVCNLYITHFYLEIFHIYYNILVRGSNPLDKLWLNCDHLLDCEFKINMFETTTFSVPWSAHGFCGFMVIHPVMGIQTELIIYIYIWVNHNNSLTWNKAIKGDDFPY